MRLAQIGILNSIQGGGEQLDPSDEIGVNLTADGKQAFLIIGDSKAKGSNDDTGAGPTPTAGTAFYFRRSTGAVIEIEDNDLEFAAEPPLNGSPWPKFAIDFNTKLTKKAVIIPTGVGGADFADNGDTNNWATTGVNYDLAVTDAEDCLTELGLTKLKAIFIICGANDSASSVALSAVETAINSLVSRLQTDFPGVDIVFSQLGRNASSNSTERIFAIRGYMKTAAINSDGVYLIGGELGATAAGWMTEGNVHLTQEGQNHLGANFARWRENHSYSKWARSIISSHYDDLSTARKNLISGIDDVGVLSSYLNHELLLNFKATIEANVFMDWAFMCAAHTLNGLAAFEANGHISTNGSSTYLASGWIPGRVAHRSLSNDVFIASKIKANHTPEGTTAMLFGCSNASSSNAIHLAQNTSNLLQYRVNDVNTSTDGSDTKLQDDTEYLIARSAGNKYLYKNGVEVDAAAVSASGECDQTILLGANNNGGTIQLYLNAEYEYMRVGKHVGTDHAAFYAFMESIVDHWND